MHKSRQIMKSTEKELRDKEVKEKTAPNFRSTLMLIFENQLQFELFNARCHDSGEKMDLEKAKMFKEEMSKINSKKTPSVLNLYSMRLGVNSIMKLTSLLKNKQFQTLNLADNAISEYGVHAIKSLINTSRIQHLNLSSNMISQVGMAMILDDLIKNIYLKTLDFGVLDGAVRKNSFGVDGSRCLAALVIQNKKLETLRLEDNDIGIAGAEILATALKQNTTLKNFKLAQNHIKVIGAEQILRKAMNLVSLDLGKNFIKATIGPTLKQYVENNSNLKRLNLELNQLFSEGTKILCKGLLHSRLTSLNIKGNSIRDEGLGYISELFSTEDSQIKQTLEQLDISLNEITPEGMGSFQSILLGQSLRCLNISKNYIGDQGLVIFSEAAQTIQSKIKISKIDISSSKISDGGIVKFIQVLEYFPQIQNIKCMDNFISEKHEKILVEMLEDNTTIVNFNLTGNRLSLACLKQIKKIIERNQKDLEEREPNKIKSQIYRLKEKQKKINDTKEQLQTQNKEIVHLEETKAKLLESINKLEKEQSQKKSDYETMIQKKKEEIEKKKTYVKMKVQELENQKKKQQGVLDKLREELKGVAEKRSDLEYQIKTVQEEGKMLEKEFDNKIEEMKNK